MTTTARAWSRWKHRRRSRLRFVVVCHKGYRIVPSGLVPSETLHGFMHAGSSETF